MKILYFHQHFSTPQGSTGTRSYEFARALVNKGHEVTIVCGSYWIAKSGLTGLYYNGSRTGTVDGISVIEYKLPYSNSDSFIKRIYIFLKYSMKGIYLAFNKDYDLLFATSTPLTAGIPGVFAKIFRKKPFIFEVRDLWPELPKAMGVITNPILLKMMDWLESITYNSATVCIGLSPGIVEGVKRKVPSKKVKMIPNGCDLNLIQHHLNRKTNSGNIAVFTGAHGIANGLDAVLNAAKVLLEKGRQDIAIQFIGDGLLKPKLIERAKNELLFNCTFINPMSKKELFTYMDENVDIGLMILDNVPAFYYGTSPNKFFDYLSLGIPIINNYPGWLAEIITQYKCGLVVPPGNPEMFADCLIKLNDNVKLRKEMGKNAQRLAKTQFDRDKLGNEFVNILESVIDL